MRNKIKIKMRCFKCKKILDNELYNIPATMQVNMETGRTSRTKYSCAEHYTILGQAFE